MIDSLARVSRRFNKRYVEKINYFAFESDFSIIQVLWKIYHFILHFPKESHIKWNICFFRCLLLALCLHCFKNWRASITLFSLAPDLLTFFSGLYSYFLHMTCYLSVYYQYLAQEETDLSIYALIQTNSALWWKQSSLLDHQLRRFYPLHLLTERKLCETY